jgi:DHA1 family inner membrane transport protein
MPLFATDFGMSVPQATHAITAYALGVVVGAPVLTVATAKINKLQLLLALMVLTLLANALTAYANSVGLLLAGRFFSGLPQGVYFGAAAVVATRIAGPERAGRAVALIMSGITIATVLGAPAGTWIGQQFGWRWAYGAVAALSTLSFVALMVVLPKDGALRGGPIRQELSALRRGKVWGMMLVSALAVASVFSVCTFVGPLVTDVAGMPAEMTPIALALIGVGMAFGNVLGGRLADRYAFRGMVGGFVATLVVLALMALFAQSSIMLLITLTAIGFTMMAAAPSIPLQMMKMAPEAPTLMGALNMASFNVANAIGAAVGGVTIEAGYGLVSPIWAGFVLTIAGLLVFAVLYRSMANSRTAGALA